MIKYFSIVLSLLFVNNSFAQEMITKVDSIIKMHSNLNPKTGISVGFIINNEEHFFNYGNLNKTDSVKINENSIFEMCR